MCSPAFTPNRRWNWRPLKWPGIYLPMRSCDQHRPVGPDRAAVEFIRFVVATYRAADFLRALFLYGSLLRTCGPVGPCHSGGHSHCARVARHDPESRSRGATEEGASRGHGCQDATQVARKLNGSLMGAHWAYLLKGHECCDEARNALLGRLRELSTGEIPTSAFTSLKPWKKYLQQNL